ncbi:hypothetical protein CEXT_20211 [Caerostris extrusa]|uniref:Uncharacterized protein n=1 Tax=Caerostris extrusa TaxID=172846 RepID=A0AAV4PVF7_CAEEX|nr:hypothetical protein CEXT_20211 [Caerostris extrusa]
MRVVLIQWNSSLNCPLPVPPPLSKVKRKGWGQEKHAKPKSNVGVNQSYVISGKIKKKENVLSAKLRTAEMFGLYRF